MIRNLLMLVCLAWPLLSVADHDASKGWSWHVLSAGFDESRVSLYQAERLHGIYQFDCDLTAVEAEAGSQEAADEESAAAIEWVRTSANPDGLMLVTCNVGAHSQRLSIIDPALPATEPAFAVTGSFFVDWELQDGELWLSFDELCETGPSAECPDGYVTVFQAFPDPDAKQ